MKSLFLAYLLSFTLVSNAQRYKNIHRKAIVVDTHNDVLGGSSNEGNAFGR